MKLQLARAQALLNQSKPKPDEAMKVLQPLVNRKNAPWPVYHFSGIAFLQKKEYQMALSFLNESVKQGADEPETHHSISLCYYNLGNFELAEEFEKTALNKKPDFFKGWLHLGSIYRAKAKLDQALKCFQKANQLDPKSASVAYRIAEIYNDQGDIEKALELFDIAIKVDANFHDAHLARAGVLQKVKRFEEAKEHIYTVLNDEPLHLLARVTLAEHYKLIGNYDSAIDLYEKLVKDFPKIGGIRVNYALCLQELGRFEESEKHYMIAFEDQPDSFESLSNFLMGIHYNPERTREEIFEAHTLWDQHFAPKENPERPVPFDMSRDKKLRLGFISGGFRTHPVGWMITKALENLPSGQFEVYFYTTNNKYDQVTERIHGVATKWQTVIGYNDEVIARMIREDEIDILVELSGHSADTRLKTVALEPAPIILKWVGGLFNTTGLKSVDYLLTDHHETPKGQEEFYTEKLVRMPDDYICFMPPEYAPDVKELPAKNNEYITFGCFNNPSKINDEILKQWAGVMNRVPESRLFLKSKQYDTEAMRERIIETMKSCGIERERLIFEGASPHDELLEKYNEVDIALDPWPYSGGLTTCEALWMGVPVVTKPGPTFAGRHSTTHLINAGLPDLVADTWDQYADKVVELAADLEALSKLRTGLRKKVENSPLTDGKRFGAHFSKAMRAVWNQWVDGFEQGEENWQDHIDIEALNDIEKEKEVDRLPVPTISGDLSADHIREIARKSEQLIRKLDENEQCDMNQEFFDRSKELARNGKSGKNGSHYYGATINKNGSEANPPDTYKIETRDDLTICTPADLKMLTPYVLLEQKDWYETELNFVREYLKPGMKVADIGAGFGVYSLPAAKLVGEEGRVYAFEPGSLAKHHLEMSKLENGFENLDVIGKALSDKNGKQSWQTGKTPELNQLDDAGEETLLAVTLDSWWQFEGEPNIDLIKIDVNGNEANVLAGAAQLLEKESPLILLSITEQKSNTFADSLDKLGYALFEYIPGLGLLAEHDAQAGADPYMQNLIAVKENRIESLKENGWLHDESVTPVETDKDLWKTKLLNLPWTESLMEMWESQGDSEGIKSYLQALNYLVAAEQIDVHNTELKQPRSQKAVLLLGAAQILIGLYNQGANSTSVVFTLVRTLNTLGKRGQAVEVMQKLIETTKLGQENMNVDLPFMLPVHEQDDAPINTDLSKWLMVRTVEAWILLKDVSTYLSGEQERKLMVVLKGNPENQAKLEKLFILMQQRKGKKYFSQFGEDRVLEKLLTPHQSQGFYVDIGAFHPFKYSNTALMNLFGWKGINIDANKKAIEVFNRVRPGDKNVYTAITETDGEIEFYIADKLGEVNTLSEKHRKKWRNRGVSYETKKVPSRRLDSLLNEYLKTSPVIDFMNIDVEDAEMGVLRSNDWSKFRPRVIAIEIHGLNERAVYDNEVAGFLKNKGYEYVNYKSPTAFFQDSMIEKKESFLNKKEIKKSLRNKEVDIEHITFVVPGGRGNAHGLLLGGAEKRVSEFKKLGIPANVVSASSYDFIRKIIEASQNKKKVIFSGAMGYDLWTESDMNINGNLFDLLSLRVFGTLSDHPYTNFMWKRMERFPKGGVLLTSTASIADEFKKIYRTENKIIVHEKNSPTIAVDEQLAKKVLNNRSIDLLIPWGLHKFLGNQKNLNQQLQQFGTKAVKLGEMTYEISMKDYDRSIFEVFLNSSKSILGKEYQFSNPKSNEDRLWLHVLSIVDWTVRRDRRFRMLKSLGKIPADKQVVITAHPKVAEMIPGLRNKTNIKWIGEVSAIRLNELYADSKIVLNCNPTFPDMIHERVRNSMAYGCCVVSDYSPGLADIFSDKKEILFTDNKGNEIANYLTTTSNDLQQIASNGRHIIETQFNIDDHVKWLIDTIEKNM